MTFDDEGLVEVTGQVVRALAEGRLVEALQLPEHLEGRLVADVLDLLRERRVCVLERGLAYAELASESGASHLDVGSEDIHVRNLEPQDFLDGLGRAALDLLIVSGLAPGEVREGVERLNAMGTAVLYVGLISLHVSLARLEPLPLTVRYEPQRAQVR